MKRRLLERIVGIALIVMAMSLAACSFQDPTPTDSPKERPKSTKKSVLNQPVENTLAPPTKRIDNQASSPKLEPRNPTNEPENARISPDDEDRRRCKFWALNNLRPLVYTEFIKLNPETMDDLDRILWRPILNPQESLGYYDKDVGASDYQPGLLPRSPGIYCRDYWAEPLNKENANLRNKGFEPYCRHALESHITQEYQRLASSINHNNNKSELAYQTPNQYIRILEWIDLTGEEILDSDNPPHRMLREMSQHEYSHMTEWTPTEEKLADYKRQNDEALNLEWLGIVSAAGLSDQSSKFTRQVCHYYYPQLFYGYWIPFDQSQIPNINQEEQQKLPQYQEENMPLYLPKSVTAQIIRLGYPLGVTAERYQICYDNSETEEVGYYYVQHPAGDYCELKP